MSPRIEHSVQKEDDWTMDKGKNLHRIRETGIVAVIRAPSSTELIDVSRALAEGGVDCVEITMTTPNALEAIGAVSEALGDSVLVGVGSVLDPETARAAILAGAEFVVGPVLNEDVIRLCRRYSKIVVPGAFTPTEILRAWEAGADVVKVFPAGVGGPAYFKAIKGPLPQVRLTPTGGVDLGTAADFIRAGAEFLGVGSALVKKDLLAARDFAGIGNLAAEYRKVVVEARKAG
jgi:2-dehydro-3-deoxyphosphogluconate aldolase/(4S)-4-hydroxy-2-oxoglutarate aldolase